MNPNPYFRGSSVRDGKVQRLVEGLRDFAAQCAASNPPVCLLITGQEAAKLIDWLDTAIEEIEDMVAQNCTMSDGTLDSCALSSHACAMHFLADMGKLVITAEAGRRVIGKWPDVPSPNDQVMTRSQDSDSKPQP